jgi:hypothetical protein
VFTEVSRNFPLTSDPFFLPVFLYYCSFSMCFFYAGLASVVLVAEACRDYERQQPPTTSQSQPGGKPLLQKQNSTNSLLLLHASSSSLHRLPPPPYPGPPPPPGRLTRPLPASSPSSSSSHLLSKTDPRPSSDPSQLYQVPTGHCA